MTTFRIIPGLLLFIGLLTLPAKAAEEIRVGFVAVFSETGQRRERFDAAIARELCQFIGKPCRTVEIKSMSGMEDLLDKRVDVLVSYFDSISRSDRVAGTRDYVRMPFAFVVRKDSGVGEISPAALAGKSVAAGDLESRGFVATRFPKSVMSLQENFVGGLANGQTDLVVAKLGSAFSEIDEASSDTACCKVAEILADDISPRPGSRILVRKSDEALRKLVDKTIDEMERSGKIKAAGLAVFGFDVSPNAKSDNPYFPSAPETTTEIEPAIEERLILLQMDREWCSGVLLNGSAILSAAHCFTNAKGVVDKKPRQITLYRKGEKLARKVERIAVHPDYRARNAEESSRNDIALLLLKDDGSTLPALRFLKGGEPFLSADMMDNLVFDAAQYGFGNREVKDHRILKSRARLRLIEAPPDALFAGALETVEIKSGELCFGDSGGGLFLAPGGFVDTEEPPLLLGITSTALITGSRCGTQGHIMRTDAYAGWISATLGEHGN